MKKKNKKTFNRGYYIFRELKHALFAFVLDRQNPDRWFAKLVGAIKKKPDLVSLLIRSVVHRHPSSINACVVVTMIILYLYWRRSFC